MNGLNQTKEFRNVLSASDGVEYDESFLNYFNDTKNAGLFDYGIVFCADSFMEIPRRQAPYGTVRVDCR